MFCAFIKNNDLLSCVFSTYLLLSFLLILTAYSPSSGMIQNLKQPTRNFANGQPTDMDHNEITALYVQ